MHEASQKCAGRDHHCLSMIFYAHNRPHPIDFTIPMEERIGLTLLNSQIRFTLTNPFHPKLICFFVTLSPWRPNSRPFAGI